MKTCCSAMGHGEPVIGKNTIATAEITAGRTSAGSQGHVDHDQNANLTPFVGMEFESKDAARTFYDAYAWHLGFSIRTNFRRRSKRDGTTIGSVFVCSKEGFCRSQFPSKRRPTREGCKALISVKREEAWKHGMVSYLQN